MVLDYSFLSPSAPRQAFACPHLQLPLPASAPASQYRRARPSRRSGSAADTARRCRDARMRMFPLHQVFHPIQAQPLCILYPHDFSFLLRILEVSFGARRVHAAT
jgi:hypothetical protein